MNNSKDITLHIFSWLPVTDVRAACDDTYLVSKLRAYLEKVKLHTDAIF